jgi:hypothetical protein
MLNFFKKIDTLYFLLGFAFGIFLCYITQPEKKIIIKHPTPENAGKIVYQDEDDSCYKYHAKEVQCPADIKKIFEHPLNIK